MKKIVLLLVLVGALLGNDAPYSLDKFRSSLNTSKLQAPYSRYSAKWSVKYGKFKNFSNRYFYLSSDRFMTFFMCQNEKEKRRSELRFKSDWRTSTNGLRSLEARLKVLPLSTRKEFTFLQIHSDGTLKTEPTINLPLLRIVWRKKYKSIKNHIWAVIRLSPSRKKYKKIDLGVLPKSFFNIKISVQKSKLYIIFAGQSYSLDVSYWDNYKNYYKVGVYLQSRGCARVLVDRLVSQ